MSVVARAPPRSQAVTVDRLLDRARRQDTRLKPSWLVRQTRRADSEHFCSQLPGLFLVAHPGQTGVPEWSEDGFDTTAFRRETSESESPAWLVYPVRSRESGDNTSGRINVGRAPSCDICIAFPFVSKMHAFFAHDPEHGLLLGDHRSVNGTRLNGKAVTLLDRHVVGVGDCVAFGSLEFELLDARRLLKIVMDPEFVDWAMREAD